MRLKIMTGTPQAPGQVLVENDNFAEPFLPNVGDVLSPVSGPNQLVTYRVFAFSAGEPNLEGVVLYITG